MDLSSAQTSSSGISRFTRFASLSAAAILTCASTLKILTILPRTDLSFVHLLSGLVVVAETGLAVWLFSELASVWSLKVGSLFFAGASLANLRSLLLGHESCGCLGDQLEIHPIFMLAVDFTMFLMLFWTISTPMSRLIGTGLWGVIALAIAFACKGQVAEANDRGVLSVKSGSVVFAAVSGERAVTQVSVSNTSLEPIEIVGARPSCSCLSVFGLPKVVAPGESVEIEVVLAPHKPSRLVGWIDLVGTYRSRDSKLVRVQCVTNTE